MTVLSREAKDSLDIIYALSFSFEQAVIDDFLLFDLGPYIINALAQTAQAGIQVVLIISAPDWNLRSL